VLLLVLLLLILLLLVLLRHRLCLIRLGTTNGLYWYLLWRLLILLTSLLYWHNDILGLHLNLPTADVLVGIHELRYRPCVTWDAVATSLAVTVNGDAVHRQADYEEDKFYCTHSCTTTEDSNGNVVIVVVLMYVNGSDCDIRSKICERSQPEDEAEDLER